MTRFHAAKTEDAAAVSMFYRNINSELPALTEEKRGYMYNLGYRYTLQDTRDYRTASTAGKARNARGNYTTHRQLAGWLERVSCGLL